jgi:hypothetical protein
LVILFAVAVMLVMAWCILAIARAMTVMAWWARVAVVVVAATQYQRYRDKKQTQEFHHYFPVLKMR